MEDFGWVVDNFSIIASVSAILIAAASFLWSKRTHDLAPKRDVLKRLFGSRHLLTDAMKEYRSIGEPFIALNEIAIAFRSDHLVIQALKRYFVTTGVEELTQLIREMAQAAGSNLDDFSDDFLETPFAPNSAK